jgi:hypothetical protein
MANEDEDAMRPRKKMQLQNESRNFTRILRIWGGGELRVGATKTLLRR